MKRFVAILALSVAVFFAPLELFAFGKNKIVYDEFDWKIYRSTHFDIYFYEEERESLQKVVNFSESAYDDLSRKFNFQISKRIPLVFYATHSAFEQTNVILMFIPEGVGAFAEPIKNRMVLPIDLPDEKLLQLIQHELTHIFEYEILYQGKFGKEIRTNPPTWLMEGLASFMAEDEDTRDRMVLRDAVVNDTLPSLSRPVSGYFAYRFGHAVFRFMREKWGWDGVRDFVYEYRNALGPSVEKPLKRAFDLSVEEFDTQFRTWLRKQYLPALIAKGEPTEYGERITTLPQIRSQEVSPVMAPSGDIMASLTTYKEDIDVALYNVPERKLMRNISKGYPTRYEYIVSQSLTVGPVMGRDLAFSPSGDHVAFFAKKERGRSLIIVNALTGELERSIPMTVQQQLSPAYSPDGNRVAFHAFSGNQSDIFTVDLSSGVVSNLTNDSFFDGSPVYSADGKSLIYSSVTGGFAKLFRIDLNDPTKRYQLTTGDWNDIDATFAPDGKRIFYSSDRQTGRNLAEAVKLLQDEENRTKEENATPPLDPANFAAYNIYSINLESGEIQQYTDVVGGCFTPAVFIGSGGKERYVFSSYYKQRWQLFTNTTDEPLRLIETVTLPSDPILEDERTPFVPPVEVAIDPEKISDYGGLRLFLEHVEVNAGISSDQTLVSRSVLYMSDMLGDRRFIASLDSVSSFSNFDFLYFDMTKRLNWGVRLFDDRTFYVSEDRRAGTFERDQRLYRQTGLLGILSYPFDRAHRVDFGGGYMLRDINYFNLYQRQDEFPFVTASFSGDNSRFKSFGPISGRRYQLTSNYAYDMDGGGTLSNDFNLDARQYLQLSARTLLAGRLFAGYSEGSFPNFYYFGGLNTLRGYDFRSFVGDRAAYANLEFRFPLIDLLATPFFAVSQVRGSLFFDVGGAHFKEEDFTAYEDGRLKDLKASVGYGISMTFLGLELHWDMARRTDLKDTDEKMRTTFWIGNTF